MKKWFFSFRVYTLLFISIAPEVTFNRSRRNLQSLQKKFSIAPEGILSRSKENSLLLLRLVVSWCAALLLVALLLCVAVLLTCWSAVSGLAVLAALLVVMALTLLAFALVGSCWCCLWCCIVGTTLLAHLILAFALMLLLRLVKAAQVSVGKQVSVLVCVFHVAVL